LSHPLTLGEAGPRICVKSIAKYKAGDKYLILEEAMEAKALGVSARDAQLLEVQQHNDEQVAGIFGMPGHRVGIMKPGSVSYASVENADLAYVKYVVGAQAKANEEAMTRDLLSAREQNRYVIEYLLESLLRGDTAARAAFYTALGALEAITPNEVRERENMNPLPGGDTVVKNVAPPPPNTPRDPKGRPKGRARRAPGPSPSKPPRGWSRRKSRRPRGRGRSSRAIRTAGRPGAGSSMTTTRDLSATS
jgi:hypothetical protein